MWLGMQRDGVTNGGAYVFSDQTYPETHFWMATEPSYNDKNCAMQRDGYWLAENCETASFGPVIHPYSCEISIGRYIGRGSWLSVHIVLMTHTYKLLTIF